MEVISVSVGRTKVDRQPDMIITKSSISGDEKWEKTVKSDSINIFQGLGIQYQNILMVTGGTMWEN